MGVAKEESLRTCLRLPGSGTDQGVTKDSGAAEGYLIGGMADSAKKS